jgi:hypothetical protein
LEGGKCDSANEGKGWWWPKATVERDRKKKVHRGRKEMGEGETDFLSTLDFRIPSLQDMKSSSIYKGWKQDIWSPLVLNLGPWFDLEGSQLLAQSSYHGLSGLLQENGWSGGQLWGSVIASVLSFS